jgi:hypothetical protein
MLKFGNEPPHQRLDRVGPEKHRLGEAACVQQPRSEDVAALGVGAQLDLVDGEKIDRPVKRHRLDGADEIGRIGRQDLFFAGDQRHRAGAPQFDDPVVILARQQPQRKPDHPALVAEHALDREMGLAGVGRPKDRDEPRSGAEHGHAEGIGRWRRRGKRKRRGRPRCDAAGDNRAGSPSWDSLIVCQAGGTFAVQRARERRRGGRWQI